MPVGVVQRQTTAGPCQLRIACSTPADAPCGEASNAAQISIAFNVATGKMERPVNVASDRVPTANVHMIGMIPSMALKAASFDFFEIEHAIQNNKGVSYWHVGRR